MYVIFFEFLHVNIALRAGNSWLKIYPFIISIVCFNLYIYLKKSLNNGYFHEILKQKQKQNLKFQKKIVGEFSAG